MNIFLLTTSHGQLGQLESLFSSLAKFVDSNTGLNISCLVVESCLEREHFTSLINSCLASFESFEVLCVDSENYWTGSIFSGLDYIYNGSEKVRFPELSRVLVCNCDVSPSSWDFLLRPMSTLETLATIDSNKLVKRSGFRLTFPFLAIHHYPYNSKLLPKSPWTCESVPTRLILFPFSILSTVLSHRYLVRWLPHYSADFVFTALLSSEFSTQWRVRVDSVLTEDTSTTGLKHPKSVDLFSLKAVLMGRKSVFNIQDAFFFPVFFAKLHLSRFAAPFYILSFWIKYALKIFFLLLINAFFRAFRVSNR